MPDFKQTVEFTSAQELSNHENEFQGNVKNTRTKLLSLIHSRSITKVTK